MESIEELRERTVKHLEWSYAHGHISLEELEKRLEMAVNTSLEEDLKRLTEDLKEMPEARESDNYREERDFEYGPEETIWGVLSGIKKKGHWRPGRKNRIIVFMGGVELDFTEADIPPGVTEFEFFSMMGGIEVRVPEGVNVEVSGLPFMAGFDNKLKHKQVPGNPTLRFNGLAVMSGLEIKPPKKKKRRG